MNICPICGKENRENSKFCFSCGASLTQNDNNNIIVENVNEPHPTENALTNEQPLNSEFTEATTQPVMDNLTDFISEEPPKKKKKSIIITAIISVFVIVGVVIAGFLTDWFGLISPLDKLSQAFINTFSAKNFTVEMSVQTLGNSIGMDLKYVINPETKKLIILGETEQSGAVSNILIYKGDGYTYSKQGDTTYAEITKNIINEEEIFEKYNELQDDPEEVDWEDLIEELKIEKYINGDKFEALLNDFYNNKFSNEEWIKSYLGFKEDGNTYIFSPDLKKLVDEIANTCYDSDAFSNEVKESMREVLKNEQLATILDQIDIKLTITLDDGYVSEMKLTLNVPNTPAIILSYKFKDINKTEIGEKEIEDFKATVQKIIDDNTCQQCGEQTFFEIHGECPECGKHSDISFGDGVCWECNMDSSSDGYGYCNNCGEYANTYSTFNFHLFCEDCNDNFPYKELENGYCSTCGKYSELSFNYTDCNDCI